MARGLYLCGLVHATCGGPNQQLNKDRFQIRFQNLVQVHGESLRLVMSNMCSKHYIGSEEFIWKDVPQPSGCIQTDLP